MVNKKDLLLGIFVFSVLISICFISAWEFNGTVYDINGNVMYNATVNVTIRDSSYINIVGYNTTTTNATGWFNLTVHNNVTYMYQPVIRHFVNNKTDDSTSIDYIGQSLPAFPYQEFSSGMSADFYLREAGTINLTAVNATGSAKTFEYVVKDTQLGYPIAEGFGSYISQKTIYIPRNRNYSIMIYPSESLPISFNWNNFSATSDYDITYNSNYNVTNHTLTKQFNCSETLEWVNGYIDYLGISGWDEFTVVPFILEPGNMIYLGDNAAMPYNMSAWRRNATGAQLWADNHSLSHGFYNITLPSPAENATYILFATARNETSYYGGYRNISASYGSGAQQINFTMSKLMGTSWAAANNNITMNNADGWAKKNISSTKQQFNLKNSTSILSGVSAHIEVTVDYTNYNCTEFTFMLDTSQQGVASFYLPLINATGIKEMNIYSMDYAPKRVGTRTATQILANNNITMATFNPGDIDGTDISTNVYISLYKSNSTCDVPNPSACCLIGSPGKMKRGEDDSFNPLSAIMGGGALSFRMGLTSTGIEVHYVNVDMLASGPPSALFDDSTSESTTGDFSSALRFGSSGPTIYDYILISMPYTEGSTSTTGLNENAQVNISIPLFYDENSTGVMDWTTSVWNTATNGTSGTNLAGNDTHYNTHFSEWETLMGNNTCVTSVSTFNATNPCYIDTTNNRIWIRLPHFTGSNPSITGSLITATTTNGGTTSNKGGGGTTEVKKTHLWTKITPGVATIMKDFDKDIGIKQIQIEVHNEAQNVKISVVKYDGKPANVSVSKTGKIYRYLQIRTENLEDKLDKAIITIKVNKSWVSGNSLGEDDVALFKFNESGEKWEELITVHTESDDDYYYYDVELTSFSYFAIGEKTVEEEIPITTTGEGEEEGNLTWLWILIAVVVLAAIIGGGMAVKKKKK